MTIAFDESGNTGQNLLDLSQPYFALASVNLSSQEVDKLFKIFDSNAKELHFKSLKKYAKSQRQIIELLNHELVNWKKIKYYIVDKEIALIGHIVDRFIEPLMHSMGKDIYKDRSNIIFTNLIYIFGKSSWNRNLVEEMYSKFQLFIRNPEDQTIEVFYTSVNNLVEAIPDDDQKDILNLIKQSKNIKTEITEHITNYTIDLTFPTFNVLADSWYNELQSNFEIRHDNSKAIEFWSDMIKTLSDPKILEERQVGYGNNTMTYPLKFTKVELVDSKDYKDIQIADLIASSLCFGLKNENKVGTDEFVTNIWKSNLFNMYHHNMRALDEQTLLKFIEEGDQEGINSLDYLAYMQIKNEGKTA